MLIMPRNLIIGLRDIMAKGDVRYYLNGLRIEPAEGGNYLIATNGRILARVFLAGVSIHAPLFVARSTLDKVKASKKSKPYIEINTAETLVIVHDGDAAYTAKIEEYYALDVTRVIPTEPNGEPAFFSPALLCELMGALEKMGVQRTKLCMNGEGGALVMCEWATDGYPIDVVIMPIHG